MRVELSWGARLNGKAVMRSLCRLFPVMHMVMWCAIFGLLVCCNGRDVLGRPRAVVKALREADREIWDLHQLSVVGFGEGVDDRSRYRMISKSLEGVWRVNLSEARVLLFDCYDIYYRHINSISDPENFLSEVPFENIRLFLFFREAEGGLAVEPFIAEVCMYDGKVEYTFNSASGETTREVWESIDDARAQID